MTFTDEMTFHMASVKRPDGREKGVLLPLFSLPSKYGIGCISKEAYDFVDWLAGAGHTCWQVLPLGPAGSGDSPYQPLSSFAGNACYIDPEELISLGLLRQEEADRFDFGQDPEHVDYSALYDGREEMLRAAYRRFAGGSSESDKGSEGGKCGKNGARAAQYAEDFCCFCEENREWLEDYALFMALREEYGRNLSWDRWPGPIRRRDGEAIAKLKGEHDESSIGRAADFYRWTQFEFYRQWDALRKYANDAGIRIIGDMPFYVSYDSADCWAYPEQFLLDEDLKPLKVAGVPPDAFSADGQLWGNPLYDWDRMKEDGYRWWIRRIRQNFRMYDALRLDHFRGFASYYAIPADAETAVSGEWEKGPGIELFRLEEMAGEKFIAEDLGLLTDEVRQLLKESGLPGTKVIQFAFDGDPQNIYLTEHYPENCVAYTGTHDNDTTVGWFKELDDHTKLLVLQYLNIDPQTAPLEDAVCDALIQKLFDSASELCVIPLQDYLHLGSEARINIPGTASGNWRWRMTGLSRQGSGPDPEE